ncbi:MAG: DUF4197 domain-containing protein [Gammaproteobacteria bacterium]|nr:DUF4197 domain-containing protein [Gammaproteobacteria bacterium]
MAPRHLTVCLCALLLGAALPVAAGVEALSTHDAAAGLRAALSKGIDAAVAQLGKPGGFLDDPQVAIPLPGALEKAEGALRMVGMGAQGDELRATMNHAAEQAVAQATPVFKQALTGMSLADAKGILTGGEDAATQYFRRTTSAQLTARFKPIVSRETGKLGLTAKYNEYAGKAAGFGLVPSEDADLNSYVTAKALDGLFARIAAEEHQIRKDPLGQGSALLRKVFGSL